MVAKLRVGSEIKYLSEGKMIIFDDSFEHEAWNDCPSPRIVLIFDIWHPDFSAEEVRHFAFATSMSYFLGEVSPIC